MIYRSRGSRVEPRYERNRDWINNILCSSWRRRKLCIIFSCCVAQEMNPLTEVMKNWYYSKVDAVKLSKKILRNGWPKKGVISSGDHSQRFSSFQISNVLWARFQLKQNLSSGGFLFESSCALVIATTPQRHNRHSSKTFFSFLPTYLE